MLKIVVDLFAIYVFSFATGVGPYELLAPNFLKRHHFQVLVIPGLGLLQLTIVSAYVIFLSAPVIDALYGSAILGALWLAAASFRARGNRRYKFTSRLRDAVIAPLSAVPFFLKAAFFAVLLALVMAPVIHAGAPTTPYRVGIDQVGYAETAQYLFEGGTLKKIRATLLSQLGTTDVAKAKAQNIRDLNFQTYVDSEFLLKASRWGFPGAVAALTLLTGSDHVYEIEFLLDVFSYALMLGLVFLLLRDYFLLPEAISFAILAALALNCNLINVYYEGQLTQVFMLPYFTIALVLFLLVRRAARTENTLLPSPQFRRGAALFMAIVAFMFSAYNEAIVLLIGFVVVTCVLDLILRRTVDWRGLAFSGVGLLGGFISVLPFSNQWLIYTFANLRGLSTAGFWQPHWGTFAEILGLMNMYHLPRMPEIAGIGIGYILMPRTLDNVILSAVLSAAFILLFLTFLWRKRGIDTSFWLAPCVIILAAYVKMNFMDHILNYPYMKIYTMLTPLLGCAVFGALAIVSRSRAGFSDAGAWVERRGTMWAGAGRFLATDGPFIFRYLQYAALLTVVVTGLSYISQYVAQSGYVTSDMFAMYKYSNGHRQFHTLALLTPRKQPSIADFMLTPLITLNLVNQNDQQKYIAPYLNSPLAVIVKNADRACMDCLAHGTSGKTVYRNNSYIVVDTGLKLKDICVKEARRYTFTALAIDNRGDWPGLPSPQCNYAFGMTYVSYARE